MTYWRFSEKCHLRTPWRIKDWDKRDILFQTMLKNKCLWYNIFSSGKLRRHIRSFIFITSYTQNHLKITDKHKTYHRLPNLNASLELLNTSLFYTTSGSQLLFLLEYLKEGKRKLANPCVREFIYEISYENLNVNILTW